MQRCKNIKQDLASHLYKGTSDFCCKVFQQQKVQMENLNHLHSSRFSQNENKPRDARLLPILRFSRSFSCRRTLLKCLSPKDLLYITYSHLKFPMHKPECLTIPIFAEESYLSRAILTLKLQPFLTVPLDTDMYYFPSQFIQVTHQKYLQKRQSQWNTSKRAVSLQIICKMMFEEAI